MILDYSALWRIGAHLEGLRRKIGAAIKRAIPKSKVAWSNIIASCCRWGHKASGGSLDQAYTQAKLLNSPLCVVFLLVCP